MLSLSLEAFFLELVLAATGLSFTITRCTAALARRSRIRTGARTSAFSTTGDGLFIGGGRTGCRRAAAAHQKLRQLLRKVVEFLSRRIIVHMPPVRECIRTREAVEVMPWHVVAVEQSIQYQTTKPGTKSVSSYSTASAKHSSTRTPPRSPRSFSSISAVIMAAAFSGRTRSRVKTALRK